MNTADGIADAGPAGILGLLPIETEFCMVVVWIPSAGEHPIF